jgi:hypothetical protein
MLLVSAIAGLKTLVSCPSSTARSSRPRTTDVEERVTLIYYDPRSEFNELFVVEVWTAASLWRRALLDPEFMERLGKGSEPTPGSGSSTSSDAASTSPSTTRG